MHKSLLIAVIFFCAAGSATAREPAAGFTRTVGLTKDITIDLVWIPAGTFVRGSPKTEKYRWGDETQHTVRISSGFWMSKYEITQAQYQAVMGTNPSHSKGEDYPVQTVSWDDAVAFCGRITGRLPTEAEWEYACRAGTRTRYNTGDTRDDLYRAGWYRDNSGFEVHPVGRKTGNAWGLHDMHGNLWEWCSDWYGVYPDGPVTDPAGPSSGQNRVYRGGSWRTEAGECRSADRRHTAPATRGIFGGFRVVLDSLPQ